MTTKVAKLQRASLTDPARVEKDVQLVYLANKLSQNSMIIFTRTVNDAQRLSLLLQHLNFSAVPLHGQMNQSARLSSLAKFKAGGRSVLVATDVASRGLDIPCVDVVINFDIPTNSKDYIHRVGRTARAGRAGRSITFVTQYDVELIQRIEAVIGKQMEEWVVDKEEISLLRERVDEAGRLVASEMRDSALKKTGSTGKRKRVVSDHRKSFQQDGSGDPPERLLKRHR